MEKGKFLEVIDSSTTETHRERTHDIIVNGEVIPITFVFGKRTILPFEQGIKFMKDGFEVKEVDGDSLELPAVASENVQFQLKKDECVAKYTELTLSALKLRAAKKNGGEMYLDATDEDREDIISFITGEELHTVIDKEPDDEIDIEDGTNNIDKYGSKEESNNDGKFTLKEIKNATDSALELAVKYNIDISLIEGTGAGGNILKGDVQQYIDENDIELPEDK